MTFRQATRHVLIALGLWTNTNYMEFWYMHATVNLLCEY
jgi:hypothetical protein